MVMLVENILSIINICLFEIIALLIVNWAMLKTHHFFGEQGKFYSKLTHMANYSKILLIYNRQKLILKRLKISDKHGLTKKAGRIIISFFFYD
jgi:hypothetical protein